MNNGIWHQGFWIGAALVLQVWMGSMIGTPGAHEHPDPHADQPLKPRIALDPDPFAICDADTPLSAVDLPAISSDGAWIALAIEDQDGDPGNLRLEVRRIADGGLVFLQVVLPTRAEHQPCPALIELTRARLQLANEWLAANPWVDLDLNKGRPRSAPDEAPHPTPRG